MSYILVWEFQVPLRQEADFERAYAADGPWAVLFAKAAGFHGTRLLTCAEQEGRYLTVDEWESKAAFDGFRATFGAQYEALDKRLEGVAGVERRIGAFTA